MAMWGFGLIQVQCEMILEYIFNGEQGGQHLRGCSDCQWTGQKKQISFNVDNKDPIWNNTINSLVYYDCCRNKKIDKVILLIMYYWYIKISLVQFFYDIWWWFFALSFASSRLSYLFDKNHHDSIALSHPSTPVVNQLSHWAIEPMSHLAIEPLSHQSIDRMIDGWINQSIELLQHDGIYTLHET